MNSKYEEAYSRDSKPLLWKYSWDKSCECEEVYIKQSKQLMMY
jgi:hypothetical protein